MYGPFTSTRRLHFVITMVLHFLESYTAEELLNRQPILHMDFNVETEITDVSGTTLSREITTQTVPMRKPHAQKKKSINKVFLYLARVSCQFFSKFESFHQRNLL